MVVSSRISLKAGCRRQKWCGTRQLWDGQVGLLRIIASREHSSSLKVRRKLAIIGTHEELYTCTIHGRSDCDVSGIYHDGLQDDKTTTVYPRIAARTHVASSAISQEEDLQAGRPSDVWCRADDGLPTWGYLKHHVTPRYHDTTTGSLCYLDCCVGYLEKDRVLRFWGTPQIWRMIVAEYHYWLWSLFG